LALSGFAAPPLTVRDIDGRAWTPLEPKAGEIHLLVFIASDCPISNRYAPEIDRIAASYRAKHVQTFLLYTDAKMADSAARASAREFHPDTSATIVVDQELRMAKAVQAAVIPEAVIFTAGGRAYRGRIDDLYVSAGQSRRAATKHDVRDALDAVLGGKPVPQAETKAVGCYIQ